MTDINDIDKKEENNENKPEFSDQQILNGQENNINENQKEEEQENADEDKNNLNEQDLNALTVEKLKEELNKRKIDYPKNSKKKELIDRLMNSIQNK